MASLTEPTKWAVTIGASADYTDIPDTATDSSGAASLSSLFPPITQVPLNAGGKAPTRSDTNGLFKLYGDNIQFMQQGGRYSYDSSITYSLGAIVLYSGKLYQSLAANNSTAPTNTSKWSQLPTLAEMQAALKALTPAGTIIAFAGSAIPSGYLLCNGATVSRTTYASLYSAIGTLYGSGDGSTTFQLPDLRDRVLQGYSSSHALGSYLEAGLPNIIGSAHWVHSTEDSTATNAGCLTITIGGTKASAMTTGSGDITLRMNASTYNTLYGASTTVQPKAIATQYLIKY